jgi:hypothetical protein
MAIDLTPAVAAEMMVNRLNLTDDAELILEASDVDLGYVTIATLTQSDDWDAVEVTNIQNDREFYQIRVLDYPEFTDQLDQTSVVQLEGYRYKVERVFPPKGATRVWMFRCTRNGERVP